MSTAQSERSPRIPPSPPSGPSASTGTPSGPGAFERRADPVGRREAGAPGERREPSHRHGEPAGRVRGGPRPWSWSWQVVALLAVAVTGLAGAVVLRGYLPANPRIVVYGDSLMVEAQDDFRAAATQAGAHAILMKMWSGTAPCNWLDDVSGTIRDFQPTIAVIAFSGNRPPCMSGRDLIAAYRADVTAMTEKLAASGVEVRLVETPPRRGEAVDADGRTELDRLWAQIASTTPHTRVIRAGQSISDHGRFTTTLPCAPEDSCGPDGRVVVRAPDGIHFCPRPTEPAGVCPVYSGGARRYGLAVARGVLG